MTEVQTEVGPEVMTEVQTEVRAEVWTCPRPGLGPGLSQDLIYG